MNDLLTRAAAVAAALFATLALFQAVSALASPSHADPRLARLTAPLLVMALSAP